MTLQETLAAINSPTTPSETLEAIYEKMPQVPSWRRSRLRKKIAAHPNLPLSLLPRISFWHGPALFENPALMLLLMEKPTVFCGADVRNLYRLLSWEDVPQAVIIALTQHPNPHIAQEARLHVGLCGEASTDVWLAELREWLLSEAEAQRGDEWVQQWYRFEAFPSFLQKCLNWRLPPRVVTRRRLPMVVTEPAPTEAEREALLLATDDELVLLAGRIGQHPDRLRLLFEIWNERKAGESGRYVYLPPHLRQAIGMHQNLPADMALMPEFFHIHNPNLSMETQIARFMQATPYDACSALRRLLEHEDATPELCQQAIHQADARCYTFQGLLRLLSLMRSPEPESLRFFEPDLSWPERLATALHPQTRREVREYLMKDTHRWVRAGARAAQEDTQSWRRIWEEEFA